MQFRVSGRNIDVGEALRERVTTRVAEVLGKYFDGGYSGHATVGKEAFGFHTECVVHLDSGTVLRADAMAADGNSSADEAVNRLERRLRRYHRKLKDHRSVARHNGRMPEIPDYVITAPDEHADEEVTAFNPVVVAESTTRLNTLSVSDAVMELDMTGAPVVVFRHAGHGRVNMVYRRRDGNIGWIDPPSAVANGH